MRIFSFGGTYGPFNCETHCTNEAWDCVLTDEENATLPQPSGPEAAKFILCQGIGRMACESCRVVAIRDLRRLKR